jgi:hypothetical protein
MSRNDSFEAWVEDFADLDEADGDGEADFEAELEADGEDYGDAEAVRRSRRSRRGAPRRRATRASRGYGVNRMEGVGQGIVRTPSGDAQIELPGKVPSLKEFKDTVGTIQKDMLTLAAQQKTDVAYFNAQIDGLKKDLVKSRKQAALIGVAIALAPVVTKLLQQQLNSNNNNSSIVP